MNFEFKHLLPEDFSDNSKVWVYQSSRLLSLSEALQMEELLQQFVQKWLSHGSEVKGYANLLFGQFVVLMADDTHTVVGGCSTDSSVRFIKELGQRFTIDFFNRTNLAFVVKDKIQTLPLNQISYAFENGFITADTLFFNNVVTTKEQLENNWLIPVKDSWLAKKLPIRA
jgi:hypothetical protein